MSDLPTDLTINGLLYRRVPVTVPEEPPPAPRLVLLAHDLTTPGAQPVELGATATLDGAKKWGITADAGPEVTQVRFYLEDVFERAEHTRPFSLYGDVKGVPNPLPAAGAYRIEAQGLDADGVRLAVVRRVITLTAAPAPDPTGPPPTEEPPPAPTPEGVLTDAEVEQIKREAGPYAQPTRTVGNLTVAKGETVENVVITGKAVVYGTLRNFVSTGGNVEVKGGIAEHGEITNPPSGSGLELQDAGPGTTSVGRYLEIHHLGSDGVKIQSHARLTRSFIHHLGTNPQSHADGIQARAVGREVTDVIVEENVFLMPSHARRGEQNWRDNPANWPDVATYGKPSQFRANSCNYLEGVIGDYLVLRNWFSGGNKTVSCGSPGSKVRYLSNRFTYDFNHGVRDSVKGTEWTDFNWSDNYFIDGKVAP